jgi:hypothetical protein
MKSLGHSRCALAMGAAAALLGGCGGSQPPIGASRSLGNQIAAQAKHGQAGALMYVAGLGASSYILTYPRGKLIGTINLGARGACSWGGPRHEASDACGGLVIS